MEVKVKLQLITIRDNDTGKELSVKSVRTAEEIAGYVQESEKDAVIDRLEKAVAEIYNRES